MINHNIENVENYFNKNVNEDSSEIINDKNSYNFNEKKNINEKEIYNASEKLLSNNSPPSYSTYYEDFKNIRKRKKLKWATIFSFACPMIGVGGMNLISTTYASFFYTDIIGLKTVGNVHLTLMFTYAFSEPIFGCISDISKGNIFKTYGKRKPFLLVSSIFQAISFFLLLNPPIKINSIGNLKLWSYILSIIFGMSWGCSEVAHHSLASQLTYDYDERSKLQLLTSAVSVIGSTSCGLLNGILGSFLDDNIKNVKKQMFIITLIYSILYLIGIFITLVVLKDNGSSKELWNSDMLDRNNSFKNNYKIIKNMFKNKPFKLLLTAYSFTLLSGAVSPMLLPYFCRYVIESTFLINWSPLFFTTSAIIGIPFWICMSKIFSFNNKKWKYILSSGLLCFSLTTCSFVVKKNEEKLFLFFCIIGGLSVGSFFSTPEAMKADVIDYDEFLNGIRNDAKYSGFFMCFANLIAGIGLKFSLYYINLFGYDNSKNAANEKLTWAIRSAFAGFISITFLIICFTMFFYPIDRNLHEKILEGTKLRKNGQCVEDPLNPGKILLPFSKIDNHNFT
ncbi:sugar transporter, putative [Plasmodium gallinaceum]|uniref:Sugar transporter, putative n=1 Tax=Plasmodium gallinaceum TaxID=5849 RepID=A0A1J1GL59_PLAGA|nr:sugar transporter, putative [Plasmodium gallinaceum]CRG93059.1 sugar transporter, putative [Plasmodium gallinaceum]